MSCRRAVVQLHRLRRLLYPCTYTQFHTSPLHFRQLHTSPLHFKPRKQLLEEDPLRDRRNELIERNKNRVSRKAFKFTQILDNEDEGVEETKEVEEAKEREETETIDPSTALSPELPVVDTQHDETDTTQTRQEEGSTSVESYTTTEREDEMPGNTTTEREDDMPGNIMGDLETLFKDTDPEPVILEETGVVESVENVDYNVYYNPVEGDRYAMPELPLDKMTYGSIPLNHIIQFLRDNKCFDTEVIEVEKKDLVSHVIITSTHNSRHLKTVGSTFAKMCRSDYNMAQLNDHNYKSTVWLTYDTVDAFVHFMVPTERVRLNLESLWLGEDIEEESLSPEQQYTADLLEGLFPDEDFTRLGKPFQLVVDKDN